jgi:protein-S-isoprenylcysteine O-methyltransferase Ste14
MILSNWLISASWLVFIAYWIITAVGVKRNIGSRPWKKEIWLRAAIFVIALPVFLVPVSRHALWHVQQAVASGGMALSLVGAALCVLGVGFAVWARAILGRNWGMPMSHKENPELITGGPYAYVRHPIYGGLLMAMLGSVIGGMVAWLLPLVLCLGYFAFSARSEERLMLEQFPGQYPAYMKRTKMFVPFVI